MSLRIHPCCHTIRNKLLFITKDYMTFVVTAKTILENEDLKQTSSEEEDERGKEDAKGSNDDESLVWREACCTALERHSDNAEVQVSNVLFHNRSQLVVQALFCC